MTLPNYPVYPRMHLHLDPVGGVAGDMFAAALLDLHPELEPELQAALAAAGLDRLVSLRRLDHRDHHGLSGARVEVRGIEPEPHPHRAVRDVLALFDAAELADGVRARARDITMLLAEAEAQVHSVAPIDVTLHEVGAWDSIADVLSAAWLIERLAVSSWSCSPLPQGSGWVDSAHGRLPLPAPATALLLRGFPLYQDDLEGERVTPTGAAIVRHLAPSFEPQQTPRRLLGVGSGFGRKTFPGISNALRVLAYADAAIVEQAPGAGARSQPEQWDTDQVAVLCFEVDDQSPEDLAVGLDNLRAVRGVLDVLQSPAAGKKNRLLSCIQVLAEATALEPVTRACLLETSTLGVRWRIEQRALLKRELRAVDIDPAAADGSDSAVVRVKQAHRPDGGMTLKAEIDDLRDADNRSGREALRRRAEQGAGREDQE